MWWDNFTDFIRFRPGTFIGWIFILKIDDIVNMKKTKCFIPTYVSMAWFTKKTFQLDKQKIRLEMFECILWTRSCLLTLSHAEKKLLESLVESGELSKSDIVKMEEASVTKLLSTSKKFFLIKLQYCLSCHIQFSWFSYKHSYLPINQNCLSKVTLFWKMTAKACHFKYNKISNPKWNKLNQLINIKFFRQ